MLSLRRALFERMLNLPLPRLSEMKTGGILSRLMGEVDPTTGLLQTAIVSPLLSIVRLGVAIVRLGVAIAILVTLNWRLALTALAVVPGIMVISAVAARRGVTAPTS
jgi:ATP-binding cassette subfamily B protein/subfamily B ATP-binding cassette protein MsbA